MSGLVFPTTDYDETQVALVFVPLAFVPALRLGLQNLQKRETWFDRGSWWRGYQVSAWIEEQLMTPSPLQELIDGQNRIYRLLDSALNGTQYTWAANPADPARPVIGPEIPIVPPAVGDEPLGARAQLHRLYQLAENGATGAEFETSSAMLGTVGLDYNGSWRARLEAIQGVFDEGWFGIGGQQATLADIVKSLRVGDSTQTNRLQDLLDAIGAASDIVGVVGVIKDFIAQGASTTADGILIATLVGASLGNTATQGIMAGQLDRIIATLDGGGLSAPSDNILATLNNVETMLS